jgi:hypothetical protein
MATSCRVGSEDFGEATTATGVAAVSTFGAFGDRVLALGDRVLALGERVLALGERVLAVGDRVLAVGDRVLPLGDRVALAVGDSGLMTTGSTLRTGVSFLTGGDDAICFSAMARDLAYMRMPAPNPYFIASLSLSLLLVRGDNSLSERSSNSSLRADWTMSNGVGVGFGVVGVSATAIILVGAVLSISAATTTGLLSSVVRTMMTVSSSYGGGLNTYTTCELMDAGETVL